ncbi:MAG: hypothetical protein ACLTF9_08075 [Clostridium sp.]|uniref:hypothetical protein n=1 Tax=Clostridia TaxID=186801 RepID=UPI00399588F0
MILTKKDLKEYLKYEKRLYGLEKNSKYLMAKLINSQGYMIWKYQKNLRKSEYFYNRKNKISKLIYFYYKKKLNKLGQLLGIEIKENCIKKGLRIFHSGSIIVNSKANIGENCRIVGNVCIGNNKAEGGVPKIGDNVLIGVGAIIIGDIEIGDNIIIAAGSLVNKTFLEKGITIGGIPAKKIK